MAVRKSQKPKRKVGAQKSAKPKRPRGKGKPFAPGNPWRIQPGEVRNPGGRPKLLSDAYREWLAIEDPTGTTNAAKVAASIGQRAVASMDVQAAKEMRQATEGDKLTFDLSKLTDEQLQRLAAGEDPRAVLAASGPGGAGAAPAEDNPTGG